MDTPVSLAQARTGGPAYVYRIFAAAALPGLLSGFGTAVVNGAPPFPRLEFHLTDFELELVAGALLCGCVFGAAGSGWAGGRLGRRKALLLAAVLFTAAGAFWLYAAICAVAFVFVPTALPETKGTPLEAIAQYWSSVQRTEGTRL